MAKFSYFTYFFNFSGEDVETIHEYISNYDIVDFVFENSEASMQMAVIDNGFYIKVRRLDDLEYRIEGDNAVLRLYFNEGEVIAELGLPVIFSSVTVERHE